MEALGAEVAAGRKAPSFAAQEFLERLGADGGVKL
jgi:hypothetical protein